MSTKSDKKERNTIIIIFHQKQKQRQIMKNSIQIEHALKHSRQITRIVFYDEKIP